MVRPATTMLRCQEIHAVLLHKGVKPGHRFPRPKWDKMIVQSTGVGINQARNITDTGDAAGLWRRIPHHGPQPGAVEILPPRTESTTHP